MRSSWQSPAASSPRQRVQSLLRRPGRRGSRTGARLARCVAACAVAAALFAVVLMRGVGVPKPWSIYRTPQADPAAAAMASYPPAGQPLGIPTAVAAFESSPPYTAATDTGAQGLTPGDTVGPPISGAAAERAGAPRQDLPGPPLPADAAAIVQGAVATGAARDTSGQDQFSGQNYFSNHDLPDDGPDTAFVPAGFDGPGGAGGMVHAGPEADEELREAAAGRAGNPEGFGSGFVTAFDGVEYAADGGAMSQAETVLPAAAVSAVARAVSGGVDAGAGVGMGGGEEVGGGVKVGGGEGAEACAMLEAGEKMSHLRVRYSTAPVVGLSDDEAGGMCPAGWPWGCIDSTTAAWLTCCIHSLCLCETPHTHTHTY